VLGPLDLLINNFNKHTTIITLSFFATFFLS